MSTPTPDPTTESRRPLAAGASAAGCAFAAALLVIGFLIGAATATMSHFHHLNP